MFKNIIDGCHVAQMDFTFLMIRYACLRELRLAEMDLRRPCAFDPNTDPKSKNNMPTTVHIFRKASADSLAGLSNHTQLLKK